MRNAVYSPFGYAIGFQHEKYGPSASLRAVKPYTLSNFWNHELGSPALGLPVTLSDMGDSSSQQISLHYVGLSESEPQHVTTAGERQHIFEWGYGKFLQVPEAQLRFRGLPFQAGELSLFHGDQITQVAFLSEDEQEGEEAFNSDEEDPNMIPTPNLLSVEKFTFSPARQLYLQSKKINLLHVLDVELHDGKPVIISVDTFNDRDSETMLHTIPLKASLDNASCQRLLPYFKMGDRMRDGHSPQQKIHVLGRMDFRRFEGTLGRDVEYNHVFWDFNRHENGIRDGDRLFLECGQIERKQNDWLLRLHPLKILNCRVIGQEMKDLGLLRRSFSAREDVLPKIVELNGKNALQKAGIVIMAQLYSGAKYVRVDIKSNPVRQIGALQTFLESQGGTAFAVVAEDVDASTGIKLELRPGIFVQVGLEDIHACSENLTKGAIVRVKTATNGRFVIERAMFGQKRYFTSFRPVVVLPMNPLFKEEIWKHQWGQFWKDSPTFTLGGVPNLQARLSDYFNNTWRSLRMQQGIMFMQTPFPMIGMAALSREPGSEEVNIRFRPPESPDQSNWYMGRLDIEEGSLDVRCVLFTQDKTQKISLSNGEYTPWRWLTYGDQTVVDIKRRIQDNLWHYHDQYTNHWPKHGEDLAPEYYIGERSATKGPIFFQVRKELNDQIVLRYSQSNLTTYGFPVETLLSMLRAKTNSGRQIWHRFPVVANSVQNDSFWIEMTPGCVVEVPIQLCQILVGGRAIILPNFDWTALGTGDFVELALVPNQDYFAIDQLMLKWEPGVRRMLSRRCFMPRKQIDSIKGATIYGEGRFTVMLPSENPEKAPKLGMMTPDNNVEIIESDNLLSRGDVVLLTINSKHRVEVAGFPDLLPLPDLSHISSDWTDDPFHTFFIQQGSQSGWEVQHKKIISLIQASGGAIPVTVQYVDRIKSKLFYSRYVQKTGSVIPKNRNIVTKLLGTCYLHNTKIAILLWGGGLIRIPAWKLVYGLHPKSQHIAVQVLVQNQVDIWIRQQDRDDDISPTLMPLQLGECFAKVVASISSDEPTGSVSGLILQERISQALLWLPASRLAWTTLSYDEMLNFFPARTELMVYVTDAKVSVIDRKKLQDKFEDSTIGSEMTVTVLKERQTAANSKNYLVRSLELGVLLECQTHPESEPLKEGEEIIVEVVDRQYGNPSRLIVTPIGSRKIRVMLPQWFLNVSHRDRRIQRPCHKQRMRWLTAPAMLEMQDRMESNSSMRQLESKDIEQIICQSIVGLRDPKISLSHAYMAAWEWCDRNVPMKEMDVIPALASLRIFFACMQYPKNVDFSIFSSPKKTNFIKSCYHQAFNLAHNIGRRAVRSMHVEILLDVFVRTFEDEYIQSSGLWPKLWKIGKNLKSELGTDEVELIRRYCHSVSFTGDEEHTPIANALSSALGDTPDNLIALQEGAQAIKRILNLHRSMPPVPFMDNEDISPIIESTIPVLIHLLQVAFDYILFQDIDLTLLEALPKFRQNKAS